MEIHLPFDKSSTVILAPGWVNGKVWSGISLREVKSITIQHNQTAQIMEGAREPS